MYSAKAKIRFFVVGVVLAMFFLPFFSSAEGEAAPGLAPRSYLFYLAYDHGALSLPVQRKVPYDLPVEQFTQGTVDAQTAYRGEVISMGNEIISTFFFDPKNGKPADFSKGEIAVRAPYFADALKVNFYNTSEKLILSVPVDGTSFCNDDGVCQADIGENVDNCSYDCRYVPQPVSSAPLASPIPSALESPFAGLGTLLAIAGIVVCGAALFIVKRKK